MSCLIWQDIHFPNRVFTLKNQLGRYSLYYSSLGLLENYNTENISQNCSQTVNSSEKCALIEHTINVNGTMNIYFFLKISWKFYPTIANTHVHFHNWTHHKWHKDEWDGDLFKLRERDITPEVHSTAVLKYAFVPTVISLGIALY